MNLKKLVLSLGVLMLCGLGTADAQWISGVRATTISEDAGTGDVTIDATVFYTTGVTFGTAFLGVTSGFGTIAPAVDWNDGSTVPPYWPGGGGIPFAGTESPAGAGGPQRAYRMGFMHTYATPVSSNQPITVNSHFTGGISPAIVFTGNTTTAPTPTYSVFGGIQTFLSNTVQVFPPQPIIDIPTTSQVGLLLLALVLIAVALPLLRK